jgi:hypothetical protein
MVAIFAPPHLDAGRESRATAFARNVQTERHDRIAGAMVEERGDHGSRSNAVVHGAAPRAAIPTFYGENFAIGASAIHATSSRDDLVVLDSIALEDGA